jgi:Xaa-Pro aminopeptidase
MGITLLTAWDTVNSLYVCPNHDVWIILYILSTGVGLEGHETPYLRENYASPLRINNTFSNEPGVYIEGDVGIRLEDCFYVSEDGPVMFTERAKDPWNP